MAPFILLLFVSSLASISTSAQFLGVNYGTLGDNLPAPDRAIQLIQSISGGGVRIYDANSTILQVASRTKLRIAVSVPNELIISIAYDQSAADTWVTTNILPFGKHITYIFVGNEILSDLNGTSSTWPALVPAMTNIYRALQAKSLKSILVSTPFAMDFIDTILPPSSAQFRSDIPYSIISSLLKFLNDTNSYFFVQAYPYFEWSENYNTTNLDYALFRAKSKDYFFDSGTNLTYMNLLDQMLDSVISAMGKLGYGDIKLGISETGWPNAGDVTQVGASVYNAAMYNRNLAHKLGARKGTPLRPKVAMPAFVFSLFNENLKGGFETERHWGLFNPDETAVYPVDLMGRKLTGAYPPIPLPTNNKPYPGRVWCVLNSKGWNSDPSFLVDEITKLCKGGDCKGNNGDCRRFLGDSLQVALTMSINYLWQQSRDTGMPCYFDGLAHETTSDPGMYSCVFPYTKT
ncbi:hypothetical protein LUZ60_013753 [Juncus effusus]|nr:hypothetical protein LUZ60_013753 [Juncus effusus]